MQGRAEQHTTHRGRLGWPRHSLAGKLLAAAAGDAGVLQRARLTPWQLHRGRCNAVSALTHRCGRALPKWELTVAGCVLAAQLQG
jgi:hypothetical protein